MQNTKQTENISVEQIFYCITNYENGQNWVH